MTAHTKFLEFVDTLGDENTNISIESFPADQHWVSSVEINGEEAKLLQLDDNYIFIFNDEAQVLNFKQYNTVASSFKQLMEFLQKQG